MLLKDGPQNILLRRTERFEVWKTNIEYLEIALAIVTNGLRKPIADDPFSRDYHGFSLGGLNHKREEKPMELLYQICTERGGFDGFRGF